MTITRLNTARSERTLPTAVAMLASVIVTLICGVSTRADDQRLALAGGLQLSRLLDLCAERLGIRLMYEPRDVSHVATLRLPDAVDLAELWSMTNRLLIAHDLTTVRLSGDGDLLCVVHLSEARDRARLESGIPQHRAGYESRLIPLTTADAGRIATTLKPLLSRWGDVTTAGDRAVLVSDLTSRLHRVDSLVHRLDTESPATTLTTVPLAHQGASDVANLVMSIASDDSSGALRTGRVVALPDTRTVAVIAPRSESAYWTDLIARLDVPRPESTSPGARRDERETRTYRLRNRGVHEVMRVVRMLIDHGGLEAAPTDASRARTLSPELSPAMRPEHHIINSGPAALTLADDPETNTILAIGTADRLDLLESLIESIDIRQPQVMIEAVVLTLSDRDTTDLGIELQKQDIAGSTLTRLTSLFGVGGSDLDAAPDPGLGLTGVVLSPADFSIVVRALETVNNGRTVTLPRVLAGNNQTATLDAVVEVPLLSLNASDSVATTSYGGASTAGTEIVVTPHIAAGDHLVLEYSASISAFVGGSTSPSLPPPRQANRLSSTITIPDAYTVAVGGLEVTSDTAATSRVPVISSLPVIGPLFQSQSETASRSRFFVFIRARIVESGVLDTLRHLDTVAWSTDHPLPQPRLIP